MAYASDPDTIGVSLLRATTTNLDGSGIRVAQTEADENTNQPPTFEVNPASAGQPASLFTFSSTLGSSTVYPNSVGSESAHADWVAGAFYGLPGGVATNVDHVDNYDADYFYSDIVSTNNPPDINDQVVNQSFIFGAVSIPQQQQIDTDYDDYAARYYTLFVSGAGNGGPVSPPSTCYNGIGVGAYGGSSSVGPTPDNGRAKPDITAPGPVTSISTPLVAGAAALLLQAGAQGDGGSDTNAATDIRTLKALLLNGSVKPADWTNGTTSPLDARYGAGVLNVFNSYEQLGGGRHAYIVSNSVRIGSPHPPTGATGAISTLSGWDFNTNSSNAGSNGVNHYCFNVTNDAGNTAFSATATLVWNRQRNQTAINDLDLFLYNASSSNLVASSTSAVDNVEHLFVPALPQGRYDLQVFKHGGVTVSAKETYALAFEFFCMRLEIAQSDTNTEIRWPVYPAGFTLLAATALGSPGSWTTNHSVPVVTSNWNTVAVDASSGSQFFQLRRP